MTVLTVGREGAGGKEDRAGEGVGWGWQGCTWVIRHCQPGEIAWEQSNQVSSTSIVPREEERG
jgi:hypothetical protein